MQRVFCSTVLVAALSVAGLTACGDKVNVTQPPPDSAVTQVTVSPAAQTLGVGDKFTFVATVVAGPQQTNRNVTWSSSNPAVASVDNAGVVTAIKGGVTSIIAASVANPAIKGAAAVTVNEVVATVTIGQINQTKCDNIGGCTSVPAVLSNVANQLDVTLNVDAGTQKISEVDLIMNCAGGTDTIVAKQTFAAADIAPDAEDASAPTTLSFNTAAFNPTTGAVAFKNGQCTVKAKAITTAGTQIASGSQTLTLNNTNFIASTITTTPGTGQVATATDNVGLLWHAGAVNVTAVPVFYTAGVTIASGAISLINKGADHALGKAGADLAPNAALAVLSNLTPATGVITASFPLSTSNAAGVGGAVVDTLGVLVTTVGSNGESGPTDTASVANFIRLDNRAPDISPTAPVFVAGTQHTNGGWIGKNFVFSVDSGVFTLNTAATDNAVAIDALGANNSGGGVDKVTVTTQSAPPGSASNSADWTTFTSVTSLAESASGASYGLRIKVCDALGNCSTTAELTQFGVDKTPPSLDQVGGPENNSVFNCGNVACPNSTIPATFDFAESDTASTAGATPSGQQGLLVAVQGLQPSGASGSKTSCILPVDATHLCGTQVSQTGVSFATPGAAASGEYTATIVGIDQAGNQTAPITIKYYNDVQAPVVSTAGVTVPGTVAGDTTFASSATDDMDVAAGNGTLIYPAIAKFVEAGTATPTGATFDNALTRAASITVKLGVFYRSLSPTPGTAGTKPNQVGIRVLDAARNLATPKLVDVPADHIAAGTTFLTTGATGITAFALTIDSATVAATHSVVLTSSSTPADLTNGGTPFQQVCFFYSTATGLEGGAAGVGGNASGDLVKIGCTGSLTIPPGPRTLVYKMTWAVPAALAGESLTVYAVGNNAGTDALISAGVALPVGAVPTP